MGRLKTDRKTGQKYYVENGMRVYIGIPVKDRLVGRVYECSEDENESLCGVLKGLREEFITRGMVQRKAVRDSDMTFDLGVV